jgi:hypothetical protein
VRRRPVAPAGDGLVALTNDGPEVLADDPWEARLDLVQGIRDGLGAAGS